MNAQSETFKISIDIALIAVQDAISILTIDSQVPEDLSWPANRPVKVIQLLAAIEQRIHVIRSFVPNHKEPV